MDLAFALPIPHQTLLIQKCCLKPTFGLSPSFLSKKKKPDLDLDLQIPHQRSVLPLSNKIFFKNHTDLFFGFFESKLTWNPVTLAKKITQFVYLLSLQIIFYKVHKKAKNVSRDFPPFFKFKNIDKTKNMTWNKKFYCFLCQILKFLSKEFFKKAGNKNFKIFNLFYRAQVFLTLLSSKFNNLHSFKDLLEKL